LPSVRITCIARKLFPSPSCALVNMIRLTSLPANERFVHSVLIASLPA